MTISDFIQKKTKKQKCNSRYMMLDMAAGQITARVIFYRKNLILKVRETQS